MKTTMISWVFITTTTLILCSSCSSKQTEQQADQAVLVKTEPVVIREIDQLANFTATVEPYKKNSISPAQPMRIKKLYVEVGDFVKQGQILAEMDMTSLDNIKSQLDNYERDYKRYQELVAVGGASQQQLDQIKMQLDMASTNYTNMKENTKLISPISGAISVRNYYEGDFCSSAQPLYVVEQISSVKVKVNVSESLYTFVKMGMPVDIKLDVYADQRFTGKVTLIYPTIDPATRTFVVEITIPNSSLKIRPGMFARVDMAFGKALRPVVSDRAIVKQSGSNERYIFIIRDNKAVFQKVILGRRLGNDYELLTELKQGDQVAVTSLSKLIDGRAVEVQK